MEVSQIRTYLKEGEKRGFTLTQLVLSLRRQGATEQEIQAGVRENQMRAVLRSQRRNRILLGLLVLLAAGLLGYGASRFFSQDAIENPVQLLVMRDMLNTELTEEEETRCSLPPPEECPKDLSCQGAYDLSCISTLRGGTSWCSSFEDASLRDICLGKVSLKIDDTPLKLDIPLQSEETVEVPP